MKIYIDKEYHCHTSNPDGVLREIETDFFDGKCATFVEGYCFVPAGESCTRDDNATFIGEMIAPWKPLVDLINAQREHEQQKLTEYIEYLKILGVEV